MLVGVAPTRWGIAGLGRIAAFVARDFPHVPDAELVAVASRSAERAEVFAREHGAARAHGSYRELIADPEVDVVYIATPHPQHHAIALAAIRAGKAVLVEKAFTATLAGAQEIVAEARARGVFAMEAMWTRFQPAVVRARELLPEIGSVVSVQADLGIKVEFDPADRMFAPELGGGALRDVGVYVVSLAQMVLGTPPSVHAVGALARSGVEASATLLLGTDGSIELPPRFHHPTQVILHRDDGEPETFELPPLGRGYAHELIEVTERMRAGETESEVMPLDDTLAVMSVVQQAADQLGVTWSEDPAAAGS
jgi:hypothetical protein